MSHILNRAKKCNIHHTQNSGPLSGGGIDGQLTIQTNKTKHYARYRNISQPVQRSHRTRAFVRSVPEHANGEVLHRANPVDATRCDYSNLFCGDDRVYADNLQVAESHDKLHGVLGTVGFHGAADNVVHRLL